MAAATMTIEEVGELSSRVIDEVERAIIGKREALELVLLGILGDGHVLLEDYPGLAKTLIARSFAQATTLGFSRIQFTPDLMPSDVTGSSIYNQQTSEFEFRPGPIFANILLGDEINRAPPKTQAALLEAMQERQVTIEGTTHQLERAVPRPRDAEPDRVRGHLPAAGGPGRPVPRAARCRLSRARGRVAGARAADGARGGRDRADADRRRGDAAADAARPRAGARRRNRSASTWSTSSQRRGRRTRVQVGASPRGTLALLRLSRGRAALDGRDFVTPDDVKAVAVPALAHRLTLRPELWVQRVSGEDLVREALDSVPTPKAE